MSAGYEEDLEMYEEAAGDERKLLDNKVLLRPIEVVDYVKDPATVAPGTPLREAVREMAEKKIGALLVVDEGKVVGIFGERDVLVRGLYDGKMLDRSVGEFMTADPTCLTTHDSIALALGRMVVGGYRHVPLVDGTGKPEGLLTMRDVMRYVSSFFPDEVLNASPHSEHHPPDRSVDGG